MWYGMDTVPLTVPAGRRRGLFRGVVDVVDEVRESSVEDRMEAWLTRG
jgi:hypothetical protein